MMKSLNNISKLLSYRVMLIVRCIICLFLNEKQTKKEYLPLTLKLTTSKIANL